MIARAIFDEVRLVSDVFAHLGRRGIELIVRRTPAGRWSALEIRWGDFDEPQLRDSTIDELGRLPVDLLTQLSFVGPATKRFDVPRWKQRIIATLEPSQPNLQTF